MSLLPKENLTLIFNYPITNLLNYQILGSSLDLHFAAGNDAQLTIGHDALPRLQPAGYHGRIANRPSDLYRLGLGCHV